MKWKNDYKTLLILDIDETLVHATKSTLNKELDFKVFDYNVYVRPHLEYFIQSIENDFLLAIWSSASDDYVQEIVNKIIPQDVDLEFVWGRSRCTYRRNLSIDEFGYFDDDIRNHYHYIKPLKKVKKQGYNLDRILIIDDSPHKSMDNYGNAIYPKEFTGDQSDNELKLLAKYLGTIKNKNNVRSIEKRNWRSRIEYL